MNYLENQQIDSVSASLRALSSRLSPREGWVKTIRVALGMTSLQLAARLGVHPTRITRIEEDECKHAVTLHTLHKAAEAMDCDLIYALVPKQNIHDILRERAKLIAEPKLARLQHTMALEEQALDSKQLHAALERYIDQLLQEPLKHLWEENNNDTHSKPRGHSA